MKNLILRIFQLAISFLSTYFFTINLITDDYSKFGYLKSLIGILTIFSISEMHIVILRLSRSKFQKEAIIFFLIIRLFLILLIAPLIYLYTSAYFLGTLFILLGLCSFSFDLILSFYQSSGDISKVLKYLFYKSFWIFILSILSKVISFDIMLLCYFSGTILIQLFFGKEIFEVIKKKTFFTYNKRIKFYLNYSIQLTVIGTGLIIASHIDKALAYKYLSNDLSSGLYFGHAMGLALSGILKPIIQSEVFSSTKMKTSTLLALWLLMLVILVFVYYYNVHTFLPYSKHSFLILVCYAILQPVFYNYNREYSFAIAKYRRPNELIKSLSILCLILSGLLFIILEFISSSFTIFLVFIIIKIISLLTFLKFKKWNYL